MTALLEVRGLSLSFGGLRALSDVSFSIAAGGVIGLIGPNGAGKSSLLNCVSRVQRPSAGGILYEGQDLLRQPLHRLARLGITRSFQNLELFEEETALGNVVVGCLVFHRGSLPSELLQLPAARAARRRAVAEAESLLAELGLASIAETRVLDLPFGLRKGVELARALAGRPRLLLLDEPAAGLNPQESQELGAQLRGLADRQGITVLLVEHDMPLVMRHCDRVIALAQGEVICDGPPAAVRRDQGVITAYLGVDADA